MNDKEEKSIQSSGPLKKDSNEVKAPKELPKKGPLSFLSGALTSILLAWISLILSRNLIVYFSLHSINYSSAFAQSIASGFKTLVLGISFLATFSFAFIGIGLILVFIRSLLDGKSSHSK